MSVSLELIINSTSKGVDIALMRDKILIELHREKKNQEFAVGDVYLGKVKKLLPQMNACFVDVGHEKDAFLHYLD
ncbi:MAG: ribonuclease E/G, partial [Flavobacteriales bacterium]